MSEGTMKDLAVPPGSDMLRKCLLCRGSMGGDQGEGPCQKTQWELWVLCDQATPLHSLLEV